MGLNERRKIEELKTKTFPDRTKEIEEISGKAVAYDVDWDSFADDMEALNFVDNVSCHRINMALRVICQDDMGKQAVREGLKSIKIKNVKDKANRKLAFEGGVLDIAYTYANRSDMMYSDGDIRELMIKKL